MKLRRLLAFVVMVLCAWPVYAGQTVTPFVLFGGGNVSAAADTVEQVSPWIPVRGASRVLIRTWTTKTAFSLTEADSDYVDSIAVFKVAFSDSVSGFAAGPSGQNYPVAQDSVVITTAAIASLDTTSKLVGVWYPPLQEALRAPGNGSGTMTWVGSVNMGLITADNTIGFLTAQYMRVLYTPLRRNTPNGGQSTTGERAKGLKGLRMVAYVIRINP